MEVKMTMEDFKALEAARDEARAEVAQLRAQLLDAKLNAVVEGSDTNLRKIVALSRALLDCTRFAVGQLPPETTKGWPLASLKSAGELLEVLPDHTVDDVSIASEFRAFVGDAERIERYREEL